MSVIYVLISCNIGSEKSVIDDLKIISSVKDILGVVGVYDILIKLESDNSNELKKIISSKIRKIQNIRTTVTLIVVESQV